VKRSRGPALSLSMIKRNAQQEYEERLADCFVNYCFPSYIGSRHRISSPPHRQSNNRKIPDFRYSDAQTGSALVVELTTLTEDDEVMQKIRDAWSFAGKLELQLLGKLDGTFYCWLPMEDVRDDLLDDMIATIENLSTCLEKDITWSQQQPISFVLTKQDDFGQELCVFLYRSAASHFDEAKLKRRLLSAVHEADLKFEGYEGSRRILLVDISFCISGNFSYFSAWYIPDQQLNIEIEKMCERVGAIYLCKTTWAWRGDGQPIPIHGYQAGIVRGRVAPKQRGQLPQYLDTGYWEPPQLMYQREAI